MKRRNKSSQLFSLLCILLQHISNLAGNPKIVLPVPAFNVINGGSHAGNKLAMQEFMILPVGASSFKEAMKMGVNQEHCFQYLSAALFVNLQNNDGSQKISGDALKDLYKSFVSEYPNVSIEDPFDQDDWENYVEMTVECGEKVQIVGDDLLVTNPKRVEKAINERSCNAVLLKSLEAVKMSKRAGWGVMASHHSGDTEDTFIADLSVGLSTTGAPCRSERLAKYNQSAWSELQSLCTSIEILNSLNLNNHWMKECFSWQCGSRTQNAHWVFGEVRVFAREFDHVEIMVREHLRNDPYRMEDMDLYSYVLYAKEACAALSYLAHKVVLTDKYRPESCCIIGNYYNLKGQHEKTVMYFRRALKLNKYLSAWTLMGHEYVEMKNTHAAIDAYRRAVDINPCDYRAWYGLGQACEMMGMPFYALYYFRKSIFFLPNDSRLWIAMAKCYQTEQLYMLEEEYHLIKLHQKLGRNEEAAFYFEKDLERMDAEGLEGPNKFEALIFLATHFKTHKKFAEAEVYCTRLLDYSGHCSFAFAYLSLDFFFVFLLNIYIDKRTKTWKKGQKDREV
ncbi:hypothetical protein ARALYDRAFT_910072 [Arabidopsis lyrata subsp. lyrata]|uniref:phosphopyruvate hydratase n=1 Tax=Arabidopsis lyrata subsp. lyrata TaxID=81972 RepID=D7M001_ARALL|nr:hypothetical protein ARALYDRAFT_910072 [Arabidopsis lyrata subsp. lyrata]